mgnify:CR=1 FL=1
MSNTKYKAFLNAFVAWLRANTALVALLDNTPARIATETALYEFDIPCLIIEDVFSRPLTEECDTELYVTELTCAAYANTRADALVVAGQIEELAKQQSDMSDASFSNSKIETRTLRAFGESPLTSIETERGTGRAATRLRITWKEAEPPED